MRPTHVKFVYILGGGGEISSFSDVNKNETSNLVPLAKKKDMLLWKVMTINGLLLQLPLNPTWISISVNQCRINKIGNKGSLKQSTDVFQREMQPSALILFDPLVQKKRTKASMSWRQTGCNELPTYQLGVDQKGLDSLLLSIHLPCCFDCLTMAALCLNSNWQVAKENDTCAQIAFQIHETREKSFKIFVSLRNQSLSISYDPYYRICSAIIIQIMKGKAMFENSQSLTNHSQ